MLSRARWCSTLGQQAHRCKPGFLSVQVIQYLVNNRLLLDTCQHLHPATTVPADLNIYIEYPLQSFCPAHCPATFCRGFFQLIRFSASSSRSHFRSKSTIGSKDSMEASQIYPRHQRGKLCQKIHWFEYHMRCTVPVGCGGVTFVL